MFRLIVSLLKCAVLLPIAGCLLVGGCSAFPDAINNHALKYEPRFVEWAKLDRSTLPTGPEHGFSLPSMLDGLRAKDRQSVEDESAESDVQLHRDVLVPWAVQAPSTDGANGQSIVTTRVNYSVSSSLEVTDLGTGQNRIAILTAATSGSESVAALLWNAVQNGRLQRDLPADVSLTAITNRPQPFDSDAPEVQEIVTQLRELMPQRVLILEVGHMPRTHVLLSRSAFGLAEELQSQRVAVSQLAADPTGESIAAVASEQMNRETVVIRLPESKSTTMQLALLQRLLPILLQISDHDAVITTVPEWERLPLRD